MGAVRTAFVSIFVILIAASVRIPVCAVGDGRLPDPDETRAQQLRGQWNRTSLQQAVELYAAASKNREIGGELVRAAADLRESAEIELIMGDPKSADARLRLALQIATRSGDTVERVRVLGLLSQVALKNSEVDSADRFLKEAVSLSSGAGQPCAVAAAQTAAADLSYSKYKLKDSIGQSLEALKNWQLCGDGTKEIETLTSLGYAYAGMDETQTALKYVEQALSNSIAIGSVRSQAISRFQLGFIYLLLNEPQKALETCRRAEAIFPDDMDFIERARLSNGIAAIYSIYGDWESSLIYTKRALELFRKENYDKGELATTNSLINLSFLNNDPKSAFEYLGRVAELSRQLKDDFYIATAYEYVGNHYFEKKDDPNAAIFYGRSLALMRKAGFKKGIANTLSKLGSIAMRRGNYTSATDYLNESLEISRAIRDGFGESGTLCEMAKLASVKGNSAQSLDLIQRSISVTESLSSKVYDAQLKREYFSSYFDRYEIYIGMLVKQEAESPGSGSAEKALIAAERTKARVLLENMSFSEADAIKGADPESIQQENAIRRLLNSKADKLTNMLADKGDTADVQKLSEEITELRNQLGETTARLKNSSLIYSSIRDPDPFDAKRFQREVLDDDSVFLEFSLGSENSYLWLIGKYEIAHYVLLRRDQIEPKVSKLLELLRSRERLSDETIDSYNTRVDSADSEYSAIAQDLSNDLLGQVADKIAGKRLIISPDGRLGYLPFAALPLPNSAAGESLITTNEIVYTPSASMLSFLQTTAKTKRPPPTKDLMVFADPVFASGDERLTGKERGTGILQTNFAMLRSGDSIKDLDRLPESQTEARSIAEILRNSTIASGFSANRESVLNTDLANYRVIHFATHGILNEKHPELSGILLSLFDENGNASEGFIREQDIYGLDLNADLVVLSACNSGVGKEVRGEGIMSLNSAFLQAGARSVVSSLWKVDDNATEILMRNFYQTMADGGHSPAQALRAAQLELSKDVRYRSPFYWAAFTIHGDSGSALNFTTGNRTGLSTGFGLAAICTLFVLLVIYYRRKKINRS